MAYSLLADMIKLLPENMLITLSNDEAGATEVNEDNINEAIDQADAEIDSYINAITTLPLTTVPRLVANLSANMAVWNLHKRKYFNNELWRQIYEDCIRTLERINQGKLSMFSDETGDASTPQARTRTQKFTEDFWTLWR